MLIGVDSLATLTPFAGGVAVTNRWTEQCGCYETAGCNQFWQVQPGRRLDVVRCNQSTGSNEQTQEQAIFSQQGF